MNASDNQQEQAMKSSDSIQEWIARSHQNAIRMSQDEEFRQKVASRATNWGKGIQARAEQKIRLRNSPHLEID